MAGFDADASMDMDNGQVEDTSQAWQRRYAMAKDSMTRIYRDDISPMVRRILTIAQDRHFPGNSRDLNEKLGLIREKVNRILDVVCRGKMKAVVFGMTSSGKSALINALLRDNVLPSLCGETTPGFVVIEGTDLEEEFVEVDFDGFSDIHQISMEQFRQRSNLLDTGTMHYEVTTVHWPKEKCELLRNELIIIDCPGTCTTSATDEQVQDFCEDADIHIFVVSAINTLSETATKFFKDVAKSISKPNVLIVYTFWDIAQQRMDEANQIRVAKQHKERAIRLIKEDLKVIESTQETEGRIFLTSPVEILEKDKGSLPAQWEGRKEQFVHFETTFKESVSTSAIKTKFKGHCEEGLSIQTFASECLQNMQRQLEDTKKEDEERLTDLEMEFEEFVANKNSFANHSGVFVELSIERISSQKLSKAAEAAEKDIKTELESNNCELDENDAASFEQELNKKLDNQIGKLEDDLKRITRHEQDVIKNEVKELFELIFGSLEDQVQIGGKKYDDVNVNYSDEATRQNFSVGTVNKWLGVGRKVLSSGLADTAGKLGTVLSVGKTLGSGALWLSGTTVLGVTAPFAAGAAVVVGGTTVVGYGVKKGLDWNKRRLEKNLRDQCACNTIKFIKDKQDEFNNKCPGVMERYNMNMIMPYQAVLEVREGQLMLKRQTLIDKINKMKLLVDQVEKIKKDLPKTRSSLVQFNKSFIENDGSAASGSRLDQVKEFAYSVKDAAIARVFNTHTTIDGSVIH